MAVGIPDTCCEPVCVAGAEWTAEPGVFIVVVALAILAGADERADWVSAAAALADCAETVVTFSAAPRGLPANACLERPVRRSLL